MPINFQRYVISQAAILIRDGKCLILEDSAHQGSWELPGGRINEGEESELAFRRELKEEIGFDDFLNLGVVSHDIWYVENEMKAICALVFLIENDDAQIKLSSEHLSMAWISEDQIANTNFVWPRAAKMITDGFVYHKLLNKK